MPKRQRDVSESQGEPRAERGRPRQGRHKALLVGVVLPQADLTSDGTLDELAALADTAGLMVLDRLVQRRERLDSRYFIGKGKAEEVAELCERLEIDQVVFDHDLSPAQVRNLEELTKVTVVTRTEVILEIFARRARTRQARLQVELAQLKFELPRLRRMWTHLSRIEGGVGQRGVAAARGPGETQLEIDRRASRKRIHELERSLEQIQRRKQVEMAPRNEYFTIALVGYTNVGKSSLLNALTGTDAFVENRLFATLDATTRLLRTPQKQSLLLTDTVGFIRNIPHDLVASFHATLEEVRQADLLLHVADVTSDQLEEQMSAVRGVLSDLGCESTPAVTVLNKCDRLAADVAVEELQARHEGALIVSAHTGQGLDSLLDTIDERVDAAQAELRVRALHAEGGVRAYLAKHGKIVSEDYDETHATYSVLLGPQLVGGMKHRFPGATITQIRGPSLART